MISFIASLLLASADEIKASIQATGCSTNLQQAVNLVQPFYQDGHYDISYARARDVWVAAGYMQDSKYPVLVVCGKPEDAGVDYETVAKTGDIHIIKLKWKN
jgi:hypothetical protein